MPINHGGQTAGSWWIDLADIYTRDVFILLSGFTGPSTELSTDNPLIHLPTHACTSGVKPDTCMSPALHVGRKPSLDVNNGGGSPTPFIRRGSRRTGCNLPRGVAGPRRDKTPVARKA